MSNVTCSLAEHLCIHNPGGTVPRSDINAGPEIDHKDCDDALGIKSIASIVLGSCDQGTDYEHEDCADNTAGDKKGAAAKFVDQDCKPENGHNTFYHAEETCH